MDLAGYLQIVPWPPAPDMLFWSALALVAGALLGELVWRGLGLPRIVGYSAVGMLAAALGHGLTTGQLDGTLRLVVDLALALLLFELGSRVHLRWLRANPALLWTSVAEALLSFGAVLGVLLWLDVATNVAVACAALALPASAAVAGRVAGELKAAGQVTERMIVLTALNTLYAVLALKLVSGGLHIESAGRWTQGVLQPLYTFAGSALLAAVLAKLVAGVARRLDLSDENAVLLLLGLVVLALTAARMFALSTLLVPLLAGVLLRNTTRRPWVWPRHFGTAGGVLVLMLFVIVGSAWSVELVAAGAFAGLALLAARLAGKALAVIGLARWSGLRLRQGVALTLALTPLSGTVLVLLADLQLTHPALAPALLPIVLSALVTMELIGPVAVQWALRLCDETPPRNDGRGGAT